MRISFQRASFKRSHGARLFAGVLAAALCAVSLSVVLTNHSFADELTIIKDGKEIQLSGQILIDQADGLFFQSRDGKLWLLKPDQIKNKVAQEVDPKPKSSKEIGEQLLKELPAGFRIYETKHYVIAYQTELAYVKWVASLYEGRLYRAFDMFWEKKKRVSLSEPKFPLVAVVFGSRAAYQMHVDRELGPGQTMIAYYNLQNNRVTMFDLTADQRNPNLKLNERRIEEVLRNPAAIGMVATVIHEATHQLIFNRGLQVRLSDSPLWLNEGLAMYFEAPNLNSKKGWQRPGMIFEQRLRRFRNYLGQRPANSLVTLITSNERHQNQDAGLDAYAESWALIHFLINRRSKEFVAYMKFMAQKQALAEETPAQRLADFKQFFGEDLADLDKDFIAYVRKLR